AGCGSKRPGVSLYARHLPHWQERGRMPRERAVEVLLRGGGFEQSMSVFALVHGSCQDAWVWHKVIPLLRAGGHRVVAMDLPLSDAAAGANEYADAVVSALARLPKSPSCTCDRKPLAAWLQMHHRLRNGPPCPANPSFVPKTGPSTLDGRGEPAGGCSASNRSRFPVVTVPSFLGQICFRLSSQDLRHRRPHEREGLHRRLRRDWQHLRGASCTTGRSRSLRLRREQRARSRHS